VITVVVRVWLPDRPGALGQVASRIGAVRGDVLGIEILEAGGGRVVDELVVALDDACLVELMVNEVGAVDGVSVEHVREVGADRIDPDLAALMAGAELAETAPEGRPAVLCDSVVRVADAEWAVVVAGGVVVESRGEIPDAEWLLAFLEGSRHLDDDRGAGTPSDLVWARMPASGHAVAAGRTHRPVHDRERVRVGLLARMADALLA
jgi:hypothetical protein